MKIYCVNISEKNYLLHIIIHSKYFPNSDWRKAHV